MEDEIDFGKIIYFYWTKRKIILISVFSIMLISIVITLFLPRIYESRATIMIAPSRVGLISDPLSNIKRATELISPVSMKTHLILLKTTGVMNELEKTLELQNIELKKEKIEFDVQEIKTTSLIYLIVRAEDRVLTHKIVDAWAGVYMNSSQKLFSEEALSSTKFLRTEYDDARKKLERVEKEIAQINKESRLEQKKVNLNIFKLNQKGNKSRYIEKFDKSKLVKEKLGYLKAEIKKHNKFIILSKAISDVALWEKVSKTEDVWESLRDKKLTSQVINPIYAGLEKNISATEVALNILKSEIVYLKNKELKLMKEIYDLEDVIVQVDEQLLGLMRDKALIENSFNTIFSRITLAELISKAEIGDVKIVAFSSDRGWQVSPNSKKIIIVSFLVMFLLSITLTGLSEILRSYAQSNNGNV